MSSQKGGIFYLGAFFQLQFILSEDEEFPFFPFQEKSSS